MSSQLTPPTRDDWELWAVILGVVVTVYGIIRWPARWLFRAAIRDVMAPELTAIAANSALAKAHTDILAAHDESIKAFGLAIREVPRMSGVVSEMRETMSELNDTVKDFHKALLDHGEEIGEIRGALQWQGEERRRQGRRHTDPPEDHHR